MWSRRGTAEALAVALLIQGQPASAQGIDNPPNSDRQGASHRGAQQLVSPSAEQALPEARPYHYRASAEMLGLLGFGALWYWIELERNLADWDRLSLKQRLSLGAIRLDNNEFWVNQLGHPVAGAGYYEFARSNGLSLWSALGYSFATSLAWEYGLEFQERTSYNDLLVTPGGGFAFGEAFYRLGEYLGGGCGVTTASVLAWTVGFPIMLHRWLDGERGSCAGPRDALGLSARTAHHLGLDARSLVASVGSSAGHLWEGSFNSELYSAPQSAHEGWYFDGDWTRMMLSVGGGAGSVLELGADASLLGYRSSAAAGGRAGMGWVATGLGLGYRVFRLPGFVDRWSELRLPGLYVGTDQQWAALAARLRVTLAPTFTLARSFAYGAVRELTTQEVGKSVLRKQSYYYGYGGVGSLDGGLFGAGAFLRGNVSFSYVNSLEGLDRTQEDLSADERARDIALDFGVAVGAEAQNYPPRPTFTLSARWLRRASWMEGQHKGAHVRLLGGSLGLQF